MTNRTLKFRAWDKLAKQFTYPDKGYQGHYALTLNGQFQNLQNGSGGDEYVVQQWTGLKDSKGLDIYEGDIVEFEIPLHNEKFETPLRNKKHIAVIKFCNCAFTVVAKSEDHWFSIKFLHEIHDDICNLKLIVIDNIFERDKPWERFENSELLKQ
jgi:uncharacterized phage protein (TIGR01671 family)